MDSVNYYKFYSPFFPEAPFILSRDFEIVEENNIVVISEIQDTNLNVKLYLFKMDPEGEIVWSNTLDANSVFHGWDIEPTNDGGFIIGSVETNAYDQVINYRSKNLLIKVDSQGIEQNRTILPWQDSLLSGVNAIIQISEDNLIIGTSIGTEYPLFDDLSRLKWDPLIYNINTSANTIDWVVDFSQRRFFDNQLYTMLACKDSSGYVACGQGFDPRLGEIGSDNTGYIVKASINGDSLWRRDYTILDSPSNRHVFYDMQEIQDGSLVLCGQAIGTLSTDTVDMPIQQGWLVKVDRHGCLVPGCHMSTVDTYDAINPKPQLLLYPNPASDFLNIFIRSTPEQSRGTFHIYDLSGKELLQFQNNNLEITHMIPLDRFVSGSYVLVYEVDGEIIGEEMFVVMK